MEPFGQPLLILELAASLSQKRSLQESLQEVAAEPPKSKQKQPVKYTMHKSSFPQERSADAQ
jgi:hypothetical protein